MDNNIILTTPLNILLADDDNDDCLFFREALEEINEPITFTVVHDGEQLMHYLTKEANKLPTILFLDLNMPRKNGFICLEEIKHNESLKQIPVVIFSTSYTENIANLLYKNGAHYYSCKPADFSHLKKIIKYSLSLILKWQNSQPPKEIFSLNILRTVLL